MPKYGTPGVYIEEKNAFPNSIVEAATAIPVFVGYTEFALDNSGSIINTPLRINSMADFVKHFGLAPKASFKFKPTDNSGFSLSRIDNYNFYNAVRFFFSNGGGPCYIISVGNYSEDITKQRLSAGISAASKADEATMLIIPEAVNLKKADDCYVIQQQMLKHCSELQNRIAILDIYDGYKKRSNDENDIVTVFRERIGSNSLSYGASYYPWVNTTIVSNSEVDFSNITEGLEDFRKILIAENPKLKTETDKIVKDVSHDELLAVDKLFKSQSKLYNDIMAEIRRQLNILPPSSAMGGVYTMMDNTRGVWKAPANVTLSNVTNSVVTISDSDQEDLNVPLNGMAVNALRNFPGEGTLVWGARTLDGNSQDWRYVNVRRTVIMIEESIKNIAKVFVFEQNDQNTWSALKSMINNFLLSLWKRGSLVGSSPDDSFSVRVGLIETMTNEDILNGILRISVLVAPVRPAEFVQISIVQQLQKAN
ncbi:hypothetical protein AMR72_03280 [Flavobacterium psychrophilum]|nr:hypothetical protein AMR72_03280 [Flavobacterium psychrophilum]AOE51616.1 hypothetical protein ALW18_03280 [Flavobacterium psychrophilum]